MLSSDITNIIDRQIVEAKQVGNIYHFTKLENLIKMIDHDFNQQYGREIFELLSHNTHLSCTRDYCLASRPYSNDINVSKGYVVRITLDGDKMSEKYRIKPVKGLATNDSDVFNTKLNHLRTSNKESEEIVTNKSSYKIKPYIKRIDISYVASKDMKIAEEVIKQLNSEGVIASISRKFEKIAESTKDDIESISIFGTMYGIKIEEI